MKKKLFVEYSQVNLTRLSEEQLKTESAEKDGAVSGWTAPVWKLDQLNLNGRVYSTELAKRIVAQNAVTGSCDGHDPDFHAEYQNYKAVSKNPSIKDGQLWVDIYIVDEDYARLLDKLVAQGMAIGVSSVGYGETDQDGVINAQTYELVRYLDFVTYPAGQVYAIKKNGSAGDSDEDEKGESADKPGSDEASKELKAKIERYRRVEKILRGEDL